MKVYVLKRQCQEGYALDRDGAVLGVYATLEKAQQGFERPPPGQWSMSGGRWIFQLFVHYAGHDNVPADILAEIEEHEVQE